MRRDEFPIGAVVGLADPTVTELAANVGFDFVFIDGEHGDIDRILALDGLDSIMIGPYDFSASMGKAGQWDDPELRAIFDDACRRIRAAGVMLGVALDVRAEEWRARGAQWMAVKGDMTALVERWREVIRSLKR